MVVAELHALETLTRTLPEVVKQLKRIADALESINQDERRGEANAT